MPSLRKPLFKRRKGRSDSPVDGDHPTKDGSIPMIPVDPDGSTVSYSSNEMYLSDDHTPSPANPPAALTASEFVRQSDVEMDKKRDSASSWPEATDARPRQGRNCTTKSREGVPIITSSGADHFSPSAVSSRSNYATKGFYSKSKKTYGGRERPKFRPSAKASAFGGAPRYDWMDIETTAAIKIQAAYRRLRVQNRLDDLGLSTPGMRNRRAQRQARYQSRMSRHIVSADVPFPFNLCGVGLLFGDGTFEDERIVDRLEKKRVEKIKVRHEREDEEKRKFRMRRKESQHLEEGIEVVESFDKGQEWAVDSGERERKIQGRRGMSFGKMGRSRRSARSPGWSSGSPRSSVSDSEVVALGRRRSTRNRTKSKKLSRTTNEFEPENDEGLF